MIVIGIIVWYLVRNCLEYDRSTSKIWQGSFLLLKRERYMNTMINNSVGIFLPSSSHVSLLIYAMNKPFIKINHYKQNILRSTILTLQAKIAQASKMSS
jgi:hypothetical protein